VFSLPGKAKDPWTPSGRRRPARFSAGAIFAPGRREFLRIPALAFPNPFPEIVVAARPSDMCEREGAARVERTEYTVDQRAPINRLGLFTGLALTTVQETAARPSAALTRLKAMDSVEICTARHAVTERCRHDCDAARFFRGLQAHVGFLHIAAKVRQKALGPDGDCLTLDILPDPIRGAASALAHCSRSWPLLVKIPLFGQSNVDRSPNSFDKVGSLQAFEGEDRCAQ
jgi:hypothetical protein